MSTRPPPPNSPPPDDFEERWTDAGAHPVEMDALRRAFSTPTPEERDAVRRVPRRTYHEIAGRAELDDRVRHARRRIVLGLAPAMLALGAIIGFAAHNTVRRVMSNATERRAVLAPAAASVPGPSIAADSRVPLAGTVAHSVPVADASDSRLRDSIPGPSKMTNSSLRNTGTPRDIVELAQLDGTSLRCELFGGALLRQQAEGRYHLAGGSAIFRVSGPRTPVQGERKALRIQVQGGVLESTDAIFAVIATPTPREFVKVYAGAIVLETAGQSPLRIEPSPRILPVGDSVDVSEGMLDIAHLDAAVVALSESADRPELPSALAGEIELYSEGRELMRQRKWEEARGCFDAYIARFPQGTLLEEAELSRLETLARGSDRPAFITAAREWLERNRDHVRSAEIRSALLGIEHSHE